METIFIDAKHGGEEYSLNSETLKYCKKFKVIAIYAAVQFIHGIEKIVKQLEKEKIKVISSKADRASVKYQLLGCDCFHKSLNLSEEPEAFLYIGDGVFHPRALVLAQKDNSNFKEVIRYDPIGNQMTLMEEDECKKIFKKYRGSLMKFIASDVVGILITMKPGQQQFSFARKLEEKYPEKKFYYFADNNLDFGQLENFNFIECWINTACPRIGFDDSINLDFALLNVTDALEAKEILGKDSLLGRA
jgi:2-(3-amino-3-carboxypropyl)histidine synthase